MISGITRIISSSKNGIDVILLSPFIAVITISTELFIYFSKEWSLVEVFLEWHTTCWSLKYREAFCNYIKLVNTKIGCD